MDNKIDKYRDMLYMSHHVSNKRPKMAISDRAAQFSPFAALTGHDAAIKETSRLTERKIELEESEKVLLDEKLRILSANIKDSPDIRIKYFEADELKSGGKYINIHGSVSKIDYYNRIVHFDNGINVNFDDIYEIDGEIFRNVYNECI